MAKPAPPARPLIEVATLLAQVHRRSTYTAAALRGELNRVLAAEDGSRNDTLNCAAFALARHVATGLLPEYLAEDALLRAGLAVGLPESECRATIRSGLSGGRHAQRVGSRPGA